MNKTYITTMPNEIGAFLKASQCFAELGINITRVSYNKAIDSHMLFIDASGTPQQLEKADSKLAEIGYLPKDSSTKRVILVEFRLRDIPGSVTEILTLIEQYGINISYISSRENGSAYQLFKMGLFVDDLKHINDFLKNAEKICLVNVLEYDSSENVLDNSVFYNSFLNGLSKTVSLTSLQKENLLADINLAMQTLDEKGLLPYRTFDSIYCFAKLLSECKGKNFKPRITQYDLTGSTQLVSIEPDCGSNTYILKSKDKALFIDSGYACYKDEMINIIKKFIPDFDSIHKEIIITHADVDHCGLLPLFDSIIASYKSKICLQAEYEKKDGFREQNPLHKPYITICKILTSYTPVNPEKIIVPFENPINTDKKTNYIGKYNFADLNFEVYEGMGGHLEGEIILIDKEHKIVFTGDIYINIKEMTKPQKQYNQYAPILMTSVDTNASLCRDERNELLNMLDGTGWTVFGGHGAVSTK